MKKLFAILICMVCALVAQASHIIGGQVYYKFISRSGNSLTYSITLKLYRICGTGPRIAKMPDAVYLSVFDKSNGYARVGDNLTKRSGFEEKNLANIDPCIVNPPTICYQIGTYTTTITVPDNKDGYTIAFQSCCRDPFMLNIVAEPINDGSGDLGTGATYYTDIPGSNLGAQNNSSPTFNKEEATLVCADKKFTYDFSATDPDGDALTYEFCDAYKGGGLTDGRDNTPPASANPPYQFVTYTSPFSGSSPLGLNVQIDPKTGIISGIAPAAGKYVVTVCVNEYRNGKKIGTLRKDFHINITTCVKQVTASMPDKYNDCKDFTITFTNNSTLGKPYTWDFGDGTTLTTNSTAPITHTYTKKGLYTVKMWVDKASNCGDSATALVYAFPVLKAGYTAAGFCANKETRFTSTSTTTGGTIAYSKWDFGNGDTSNVTNPNYAYKTTGTYNVKLYVRDNNGCEQTISNTVTIYDKPPFNASSDTLLCSKDSLQMWATSTAPGKFNWTPDNYFILNPNTPGAIVFPPRTTIYKVTFTDNQGCVNDKNVMVDVRDTIHVKTISDSTVCTNDEIHLESMADGLYTYRWTDLDQHKVVSTNPDAYVTPAPPKQSYEVQVALGKCRSADTVTLKVVDPPKPTAAPDTTVCFGVPLTLRATGGAYYRWSPAYYVDSPSSRITVARPVDTTLFTVTVTDTLGCPKPVTATALVKVVPKVRAFAGNDTIIMLNTPFQLHATGGVRYTWTPPDGLNSRSIYNPVTTYNHDITYTVTAYTQEGCSGTDNIFVRFMKGPEIYIPNAFSPNGDGVNDIFRPLPVGIVQTEFFRVFDRWGKLVYSSTAYLQGWDGTVNGQPAAIATYVWVVQGKDINNNTVQRKGTVTLIR
ncbi:MAG: gliding motility-associated C-terminal domain-containing protein [Chitinophaga sp.]|uniref:PKD domain-containing protein n=1 Tax=Chitinophaga sp. TaxID=1869181 RepID=UPI001B1154E2|nr:PKD domain-containing protein [Chitinophaga sp.]MBO9730523.1 gliding motility-associated C-terminal domain-containing protein [Chitinophaga sp.]